MLDCRDLSSKPVQLAEGIQVVICDTQSRRELAHSEYGKRRAQCEEGAHRLRLKALREISATQFYGRERELPAEVAKRCRFIVEENERVPRLAAALNGFDRTAISELTKASYKGANELYEIGAPAMQAMIQVVLEAPGVLGARQAGAGFGGCMVAFVEHRNVDAFALHVRTYYSGPSGLAAQVYPVTAAPGAGPLSLAGAVG
jgi:galactokinase